MTGGRPLYSLGEAAEDFEAGEDAERAVEPAAIRDGIEMAADQQGFRRLAFERDPAIAGGVEVVFDGKVFQFVCEPGARFEPDWSPRHALRSVGIGGEFAQFFQFGDGAFGIKRHS